MAVREDEEAILLSPGRRVKFLCSYGGKILPRPIDGQLKYVGGETRVIVVPRDITFSELMKKLTRLFEGDVILKYQLIPEDLDALVSVTCDEDVQHMLDEYDSYNVTTYNEGGTPRTPRLRAFLFPSNPVVIEDQVMTTATDTQALEQHYVDAINGVVRAPIKIKRSFSSICHQSFSFSSPRASSPKSSIPQFDPAAASNNGYSTTTTSRARQMLQRVQSSPDLFSQLGHHRLQPQLRTFCQQPSRLQGAYKGGGNRRLQPTLSFGRHELERRMLARSYSGCYSPTRQRRGNGGRGRMNSEHNNDGRGVNQNGELEMVDRFPQQTLE
ncbi:PREDICTED: uncharacterized protein LOC104603124 [Nelumbo nucifera]|uniref:PB1 domain-containing protein n=2 Tax=Nelumbo nucifera TaxID=4432 RepID=A0A822YL80_NELNU|nr:PREDICTED: uncharacterized protein LOC104603124 [Nelumbo nucifera]DAD31666.1 TPA_asm: hypothetical protein HUJ06_010517 [Nelumbo nucifera]